MVKKSDILILFSGIMWGVLGIFVKNLRQLGFTSLQISALRWIFSTVIIIFFVLIYDKNELKIALRDIWIFAFLGIFSSLAMSTFYFLCMAETSIAVSDILMYTSPIWVLIFSIIFFKEKITLRKAFCIVIVFIGCFFVCDIIGSKESKISPLGIIFGLCSGIAYALYSIVGKTVLKKYTQLTVIAYNFVFAAIGSLFIVNLPDTFGRIAEEIVSLKYVFLLAIIGTVLPFLLYTIGLKNTISSKAAVLCCIEPVSATFTGIFVAKEKLSILQFVGIGLIIFAIILYQNKNKEFK